MGLIEAAHLDLSLAPDWTCIAARTAGLDEKLRLVAVGTSGTQDLAFCALVEERQRQHFLSVLMRELPGSRLMAYHPTLVYQSSPDLLLRTILSLDGRSCDVLFVPSVPVGSETERVLDTYATANGVGVIRIPSVRSPYITISETWEQYLASKSSNFRYNLRRKNRALSTLGRLEEVWYRTPEAVPELLGVINDVESSSWKVGAGMAVSSSRQESEYYAELLPWLASMNALSAVALLLDDVPIAYSLCYVANRRYAQMKTSFSEAVADASPGLAVTALAIRAAFDSGAVEFDFLGDVMPHKSQWTQEVRPHVDIFLYAPSLRGRLLFLTKRLARRLRPQGSTVTVGRSGLHSRATPRSDA